MVKFDAFAGGIEFGGLRSTPNKSSKQHYTYLTSRCQVLLFVFISDYADFIFSDSSADNSSDDYSSLHINLYSHGTVIASENIVENKTVRNLWENAVRYNKIVYAPTHVFGS